MKTPFSFGSRPGARRRWKRPVLLVVGAGMVATLGLCALFHHPIISRVVTQLALRDASLWSAPVLHGRDDVEYLHTLTIALERVAAKYGWYFRHGFLDRLLVAREITSAGLTSAAAPGAVVIGAFYDATQDRFAAGRRTDDRLEAAFLEFEAWIGPLAKLPGSKELLVDLLVTSPELVPGSWPPHEYGLVKNLIFRTMFRDDIEGVPRSKFPPFKSRCAAAVTAEAWQSILEHADHPREKVRAGSLLVLHCLHPSDDLVLLRARQGLADPSGWVRLAAAGLLAIRGDDAGELALIEGLDHVRWEVRFWCCFGLRSLGKERLVEPLQGRLKVERDSWVQVQIKEALGHITRQPWRPATPAPARPSRPVRARL